MVSRLAIAFLVLCVIVTVSTVGGSSKAKYKCRVYNKPCLKDSECSCSESKERLICNYRQVCRGITIKDIFYRQRCRSVFKKSCQSNDDCKCSKMVCDDHECVHQKNKLS